VARGATLSKIKTTSKEISWLSFNARVLQEAADPEVPLIERVRFLGIFSSNLDEFFRVRVATLTRLVKLGKKAEKIIGHDPRRILKLIQRIVLVQNRTFDLVYRDILLQLEAEGIVLVDETRLDGVQQAWVRSYFQKEVRPRIFPVMLDQTDKIFDLKDRSIYLLVLLSRQDDPERDAAALIEVPSDHLPRFLSLPAPDGRRALILLDDVIRFGLPDIFSILRCDRIQAYTIKLTRDAELDIDDDLSESLVRKVHKSLKQRKEGSPVRFVYDREIPSSLLGAFTRKIGLTKKDAMIPGGRYHNFKDFMKFPALDRPDLLYTPVEPLPLPGLRENGGLMSAVRKGDLLLHLPYQSFHYVIDFLREASIDPKVVSIKMTLYRLARDSSIVNALVNAVKNGKQVVVVMELQARFDEEANISWADRLREEGVRVIYGVQGLKVHAKLCLVTRREKGKDVLRALVGTGNFNEDTARTYADHMLFTADRRVCHEVAKLFVFFENNYKLISFKHLLVSPFQLRRKLMKLIRKEIDEAKAGRLAAIRIKLNSLIDPDLIDALGAAVQAGVQVQLIVRGMFSIVANGASSPRTIRAVSIVDKFLEHSRILIFANGGDERCYITSADFMPRNLDRRIEVACPVYDEELRRQLKTYFDIQWRDNVKARLLDARHRNGYVRKGCGVSGLRSQWAIYDYLKPESALAANPEQGRKA
jgi:polyphosphate kinase